MKKAIIGSSLVVLMAFGGNAYAAGTNEVKSINTETSVLKMMSMEDYTKMMKDCMAMGMSPKDCMKMMKNMKN